MSFKLRVWEQILSDTVIFELFSSSFERASKKRVRLVRHPAPVSPRILWYWGRNHQSVNAIGTGKRGHIVADTLLRTHCCRHKCFPVCPRAQHLLRTQILCPGHKNVSDFVQKHFVSATNVSQFARARKRHDQQCVRNNVFSRLPVPYGYIHRAECLDIINYS